MGTMVDSKSRRKIATLKRERATLLSELGSLAGLMHGSWVERYSTCARKECACHRGKKHGPRYYVVVGQEGRQRQKYVPLSQVEAARNGLAQGLRAQQIVRRITLVNVELMRQEVLHERA